MVLDAHSANAVAQIISVRFSAPERNQEAMLNIAFQQGRLEAFQSLKNYDTELLNTQSKGE